jgi:hypothetical protein
MAMRSAILSLCLSLAMTVSASAYPGHCQIEIVNDSHENVTVHVTFEDGSSASFQMRTYEPPHYVDLFFYGYCHSHAHVRVSDSKHVLYDGWTNVHSTIRIVPY